MNNRYDAPLAVAESVFDDLVAVERDGGGTYEWDLNVAPIVAEYYSSASADFPLPAVKIFALAIVNVLKDIQRAKRERQREAADSRTENVLFLAGVIASIASAEHWALRIVNEKSDTAE